MWIVINSQLVSVVWCSAINVLRAPWKLLNKTERGVRWACPMWSFWVVGIHAVTWPLNGGIGLGRGVG